jgi:hypothetical protein
VKSDAPKGQRRLWVARGEIEGQEVASLAGESFCS